MTLSLAEQPARTMRSAQVQDQRRSMLDLPHIAALTQFAASLRVQGEVPDFDPLDGGVAAEALFLFEKPGPMASGSGFISRDNDDPTAEATLNFMAQAGLARELTVTWNVVPWWNGTIKVTGDELRRGAECVGRLTQLLPALRVVVFVGRKAARADGLIDARLRRFASDHPSPRVRAAFPERWRAIPNTWRQAREFLDGARSNKDGIDVMVRP